MQVQKQHAAERILGDSLKYNLRSLLSNSEDRKLATSNTRTWNPLWRRQSCIYGSRKLSTNLEIITPKRLVASHDEEITIGVVVKNGDLYLNKDIVDTLNLFQGYIAREKAKAMELIESGRSKYQMISPRGLGPN